MSYKFYAQVVDKKLEFDKKGFNEALLSFKEKPFLITVGKAKKIRTNPENRYYHGIVIKILANELGYFPDEMHEIVKHKFLKEIITHTVNNKTIFIEKIGSTAELSTVKFEDFLSKIRTWAAVDLGIFIPLPNESELDLLGSPF